MSDLKCKPYKLTELDKMAIKAEKESKETGRNVDYGTLQARETCAMLKSQEQARIKAHQYEIARGFK